MMTHPLIALHGFLGLPSDWDVLNMANIHAYDLNRFFGNNLHEWATAFNQEIQKKHQMPVLMGYSLGGRLALHALTQCPDLWRAAIFISTHPGLVLDKEKDARLKADHGWAQRFLYEDWNELMNAWNSQEVFRGSSTISRNESHYRRSELASLLIKGSLGLQQSFMQQIEELNIPVLWIVGERDNKYSSIAAKIRFSHPRSKTIIVPNAGHRVPWDVPHDFLKLLLEWLRVRLKESE